MTFAKVTEEQWRAQVEKELAGKPFEKALVAQTLEGLNIQPLYTEAPRVPRVLGDGAPFRICMRHGASATAEEIADDLEGGADALWLTKSALDKLPAKRDPRLLLLVDGSDEPDARDCRLGERQAGLVSTLESHLLGANVSDEIAVALVRVVERLESGCAALLIRISVGRDTFIDLCKLRALRIVVRKVLAALGQPSLPLTIHAVASPRTIASRDPWVNMLRVSTQLFAAVSGGADLATPLAFDEGLSKQTVLGRRVARNTGHILREESALGRVVDPGAGSYYLDTLTDKIARDAWERFRELERTGGGEAALDTAPFSDRVRANFGAREKAIATRKQPVLGVSEFANLREALPSPPREEVAFDEWSWGAGFRDDSSFEALRAKADALPDANREVALAALGPFAESRARVGFATGFFAAGGLRSRELKAGQSIKPGSIVCICGPDERYAADAVNAARALREQGAKQVLLAGRPGALENDLRAAGIDGFLFLGADVIATLTPLIDSLAAAGGVKP